MGNLFDSIQNRLFDITTTTFGETASWTSSETSQAQTGRVHYRRPTEKDMMTNGMEYMPFVFFMEYKEGVFNGLEAAVRSGLTESVTINGVAHYVRSVERVFDGKTIQAHLERIS